MCEATTALINVDKSAKKGKRRGQEKTNNANAAECQGYSEMYAVVDKTAKKKKSRVGTMCC